jgi:hypothetical protein
MNFEQHGEGLTMLISVQKNTDTLVVHGGIALMNFEEHTIQQCAQGHAF